MGGAMKLGDLIGKEMLRANQALHEAPEGFGGSGWKQHARIVEFGKKLGIETMLDYGCGEGSLRRYLRSEVSVPWKIAEYDPAIPKKAKLPKAADLVVCTDVLEHVEPEKLESVLGHIFLLTRKGAFLAIATRPANKLLPDGRNAHLIVQPMEWWVDKLSAFAWNFDKVEDKRKGDGSPHEVRIWLSKQLD